MQPKPHKLTAKQETAKRCALRSAAEGQAGIIAHATGTGKTVIAAEVLADWCAQANHRALVLTDRRELARQMHEAAMRTMGDAARLAIDTPPDRPIPAHQCHVSTWQRLAAAELNTDGPLLIVSDECHAESPYWRRHYSKARARIGLTATPYDDKGQSIIGTDCWPLLLSEYGLIQAIQDGELVQIYINHIPLSGIEIHTNGTIDPQEERLHKIAEVAKRSKKPIITFTKSIVESRALTRVLHAKGEVGARHLDCYEDLEHRQGKAIRDFRAGNVPVLSNYRLWERGIDTRNAATVLLGRELNTVSYIQALGRITRYCCEEAKPSQGGMCRCGADKQAGYLIDTAENADCLETAAAAIAGQLKPGQQSTREAKLAMLDLLRDRGGVVIGRTDELRRLASHEGEITASELRSALDPTGTARPLAAVADLATRLRLARAEPKGSEGQSTRCDPETAQRLLNLTYFRTENRPSAGEICRKMSRCEVETAIQALEQRARQGKAHPAQLIRLQALGTTADQNRDASREVAALRLKRLQETAKLGGGNNRR